MPKVVIPSESQWTTLRELGLTTPGNVILLKKEVADALEITNDEPEFETYGFGGESDIMLDVIGTTSHFALQEIMERKNPESELPSASGESDAL